MPTTAILYSRISDDREGTGAGVERQHQDLAALAEREGWDIVGDFTDNDLSASKQAHRPGWERTVALIKAGQVDVLAGWASDRFTRHPRELEDLVDLLETSKVKIVTVTSGEYDLSNPEGRAVARIIGAIAIQESERKSVRQKRRWRQDIENGTVRKASRRPFGYTKAMDIVADEAAWVVEIYEAMADGATLAGVQQMLNDAGVTTTDGNPWPKVSVRRVLTSPRYKAVRTYKGEPVGDAPWEPIVSDALWERTQAAVAARSQPGRRDNRRYLLTGGLAVCGLCGAQLVARPNGAGARSYVCPPAKHYPQYQGCSKIRILAETFEEFVAGQVLEALDTGMLTEALAEVVSEVDAVAVADEIRTLEKSLDELATDYYSERAISRSQFEAAHRALTAKLGTARQSLSPSGVPMLSGAVELGEWWEAASMEDRRDIMKMIVRGVRVSSAVKGRNRFDADRVAIEWAV